MKNKINMLKRIQHYIGGEARAVLEQAIKALDNPLGVLPGDEIEVWNINEEDTHKVVLKSYRGGYVYSWETKDNSWQHARIPIKKEYCCKDFKCAPELADGSIESCGTNTYLRISDDLSRKISHCPFCGTKINI